MMTKSYHARGHYNHTHLSPHQRAAATPYYGRAAPYSYYDHGRQDVRQQYVDHHTGQAAIQDNDEDDRAERQQRKRIAVACARCRKRKIKCSGDPEDGSGCAACKSVGLEASRQCTFMRVNAKPVEMAPVEMLPNFTDPGAMNASPYDTRSTTVDRRPIERYHYRPRPSIPVLQTRCAYRPDLVDSPANNSPIESYVYTSSTIARQDSLVSTYGTESMRTCSTSYPTVPPPTLSYYDPYTGYSSFGTMQAPEPHHYSRLPSVSADSQSSFNMGHLHSSLPSQGPHERRLPVPYISQYPQTAYPQPASPVARPLGSFSTPRIPIHGIQSRNALPWPLDTGSSASRTGSMSAYAPPISMPITCSQSMPTMSRPALSYRFHPTTSAVAAAAYNSSPELLPTSGPDHSTSLDSSSSSEESGVTVNPFPGTMRYYASTSSQLDMPSLASTDRPSSSHQRSMQQMPGLYSYGTASSDAHSTVSEQEDGGIPSSGATTYSLPLRDTRGSIDGDTYLYNDPSNSGSYQNLIQHPRPLPHPSASIDNLCRQSSFEQQPPRTSTASRMSISNFNTSYQ